MLLSKSKSTLLQRFPGRDFNFHPFYSLVTAWFCDIYYRSQENSTIYLNWSKFFLFSKFGLFFCLSNSSIAFNYFFKSFSQFWAKKFGNSVSILNNLDKFLCLIFEKSFLCSVFICVLPGTDKLELFSNKISHFKKILFNFRMKGLFAANATSKKCAFKKIILKLSWWNLDFFFIFASCSPTYQVYQSQISVQLKIVCVKVQH